jgi:hypothetical protein
MEETGAPAHRLPRGTCPVCYREVALRPGDLVRGHVGACESIPDGFLCGALCPGSGHASLEAAGRVPTLGRVLVYLTDGSLADLRRRIHRAMPGSPRPVEVALAAVCMELAELEHSPLGPCPACTATVDRAIPTERPQ